MKVKLVSKSAPTFELQSEGIETLSDMIAYVARVSNPSNQANTVTAPNLLKYLMRENHWSPFEMVTMCLEIQTTRDIARQILRHRSFSYQEFSQRYAKVEFEFVLREARLQDPKNRQNSIETDDEALKNYWIQHQLDVIQAATKAYEWALDNGIAKEQARAVLPEGLTGSRLYMSGTVRSWIHYVELRGGHGTQKEHTQVAKEAGKILDAQGIPWEK
jgi:thymidylate synthase (FAD)